MPRTKGARNKNPTKPPKPPSTSGGLHKKYREIEPNQLRIVARPYLKPARFYTVSSAGVFVHKGERWNKTLRKRLLARGYSMRKVDSATFVFEKTVARKDSE